MDTANAMSAAKDKAKIFTRMVFPQFEFLQPRVRGSGVAGKQHSEHRTYEHSLCALRVRWNWGLSFPTETCGPSYRLVQELQRFQEGKTIKPSAF
jgi:hypothetical protein